MTSSLSSSSGAPAGSSHWNGAPVITAHRTSMPAATGVYVTVQVPAASVVQVKSGLLPGTPGSLGPLTMYTRTLESTWGAPRSSRPATVRVTGIPTPAAPGSGPKSTRTLEAARAGVPGSASVTSPVSSADETISAIEAWFRRVLGVTRISPRLPGTPSCLTATAGPPIDRHGARSIGRSDGGTVVRTGHRRQGASSTSTSCRSVTRCLDASLPGCTSHAAHGPFVLLDVPSAAVVGRRVTMLPGRVTGHRRARGRLTA
jgi:hypothetical protein